MMLEHHGIAGKDLGSPWAGVCEREGGCSHGRDIAGGGAARLKRRRCRVQALQGKAEGEVLAQPPLHTAGLERQLAKGFPPYCPFAAPQLAGVF